MASQFKREASFIHRSVLIQQTEKTYNIAKEKLSTGQKQHSVLELAKLWKNLFHSSAPVTGIGSCNAILALVADEKLTVTDALDKIVNSAVSATQCQWLVCLTLKLLKLQFFKCAKTCECCAKLCFHSPYQLRLHTHPLISIVAVSPQSWTSILSEIHSLFFESSAPDLNGLCTISNAIEILKPFLLYVFFNSLDDTVCLFQISTLFNTLISHMQYTTTNVSDNCNHKELTIITFLADLLLSMKVTEVSLQLHLQLSVTIQSSSFCNNSNLITKLCLSMLSSCLTLIRTHQLTSAATFLNSFIQTSLLYIEQLDIIAIGLAHLICESTVDSVKSLLHAAFEILGSPNWKLINKATKLLCFCSLKACVLPLLLNKTTLAFQTVLPLINQLLKRLDCFFENFEKGDASEQDIVKPKFFEQVGAPLQHIFAVFQAFQSFKENHVFTNLQFILQLHESHTTSLSIALSVCGVLLSFSVTKFFDQISHGGCLEFLSQISLTYPNLTLTILPSIFYAMKTEENSDHHRNLALMLPKFATHKDCVGPILATIQAFCNIPALHPFALYLLLDVWRKQERTFPYLQKVMTTTSPSHFNPVLQHELNIVKAIAIKEMCILRPFRNTSELLSVMFSMLDTALQPGHVVILLEGLYNLVFHEVVNLRSTWLELKEKLVAFHSDAVVAAILKVLSLLPKHETDASSFLQFKDEILCWVWEKLEQQSTEVYGAALVCLSHFKKEDFLIKHLPVKFRPENVDLNEESLNDFLMQPIPGLCYIKLIHSQVPTQVQYFLSSLLEQEIEGLPRDIKHRALQSQQKSSSSNVLSDLPNYVMRMYEKNKQPNLKSAFATSLLMCYDPAIHNASPKALVSLGRNALQHLQALLSEVTIDPKNWKLMLWLTNAWTTFMQKCIKTMIKGREAELNMQLQQKSCERDDVLHKLDNIDFWCRDKITDLLKTVSKGTPGMQGNSVLALAGLIHAVKLHQLKIKEKLSTENRSAGYLSYDHWIGMAIDTIISIVDSDYQPLGRIFSWCQYKAVSHTGRLTTSKLGEICAMHSLRIFLPALLPHDSQRIATVIEALYKPVAKQSKLHCSQGHESNPVTLMNLYLSLGSIVAKLYSEKVHDVCSTVIKHQLENCVSVLTKNIFESVSQNEGESDNSSDDEISEMFIGSLLGVGQLLPSMFLSGNVILQEKAISILKHLEDQMDELEEQSYSYLEAYFSVLSWSYIAGKVASVVTSTSAKVMLTKLHNALLENKSNTALSQLLGDICFAMQWDADTQASSLFKDLFQQWMKQATNDRLPTRQKLSSISGLASLVGSESIFLHQSLRCAQQSEENLSKIVKLLQRLTSTVKDSGISSNSALLLGHLYLSSQTASHRSTSMPSSYAYLSDLSVLRPMFAMLVDAQNKKDTVHKSTTVATIISSLAEASARVNKVLPPVNWSVLLPSLVQMNLSKKEQTACFVIALTQCKENQTVVAFLMNWMQPVTFKTLQIPIQCILLKSVHLLIHSLPSTSVLTFLDLVEHVSLDSALLFQSTLHGLLSSLKMDDLPQGIPNRLYALTNYFIENYSLQLDDQLLVDQWKLIADCVGMCENGVCLDDYATNHKLALKTIFVKCHLISKGLKPIQWMNDSLKLSASSEDVSAKKSILFLVYHSFLCMLDTKLQQVHLEAFVVWVQELMGYIRKLPSNDFSSIFFLKLFAVAIVIWNKTTRKIHDEMVDDKFSISFKAKKNFLWDHCLDLLPPALQELLLHATCEEDLTNEIIDCLLNLYNSFKDDCSIATSICKTFLNLHQHNVFNKLSVWTTVVNSLFL